MEIQDENTLAAEEQYYVVTAKAVPEVLLRVVEAKRLLDTRKADTIQEAADLAGISRSSFYKYKDDIFPFHEKARGKTITFVLEMKDEPGLLSDVLKIVADHQANILTIHQSIPINGVADLSISLQIRDNTEDIGGMIRKIETQRGVRRVRIMGRDNIH